MACGIPPGSLPYEQHVAIGVIEPHALASLPVQPVQLYECALLLALLLAFSRFRWRRYEKDALTVLVVCSYAVIPLFVEYLRAYGVIVLGNLTVTQLQCLSLRVSAVLLPRMLYPDKQQRLAW